MICYMYSSLQGTRDFILISWTQNPFIRNHADVLSNLSRKENQNIEYSAGLWNILN